MDFNSICKIVCVTRSLATWIGELWLTVALVPAAPMLIVVSRTPMDTAQGPYLAVVAKLWWSALRSVDMEQRAHTQAADFAIRARSMQVSALVESVMV